MTAPFAVPLDSLEVLLQAEAHARGLGDADPLKPYWFARLAFETCDVAGARAALMGAPRLAEGDELRACVDMVMNCNAAVLRSPNEADAREIEARVAGLLKRNLDLVGSNVAALYRALTRKYHALRKWKECYLSAQSQEMYRKRYDDRDVAEMRSLGGDAYLRFSSRSLQGPLRDACSVGALVLDAPPATLFSALRFETEAAMREFTLDEVETMVRCVQRGAGDRERNELQLLYDAYVLL